MEQETAVATLQEFKRKLSGLRQTYSAEGRSWIAQNVATTKRLIAVAGCFKTYTIAPPPAVGGLIMRNVDIFEYLFDPPYGMNVKQMAIDMIDAAIGAYSDPGFEPPTPIKPPKAPDSETREGYVFIAMPMAAGVPSYDDTLDAIKEAAARCNLVAERIDDIESNERITDNLLDAIRSAQYVVADLTDSKPNVFYEAGFAHGIGKTPIYIAKNGTDLEFDLKDYPIIFFQSMRELKDKLERRLRAVASR